jgi:hypothetical protein
MVNSRLMKVRGRIFVAGSDTPCRSTGEPIDEVMTRA